MSKNTGCKEKDVDQKQISQEHKSTGRVVDDAWMHRSSNMRCISCMYFNNMRCRRHAPTMQGYPAVYPHDWCGDHKIAKEFMGGV